MASFSDYRPVRIGRTTNRQLGFITPSPSESKCDYFNHRFIRHGVALKENRAICDKTDENVICDYRKMMPDGTPFCLRYWYGPLYEIVDEVDVPLVQKRDERGRPINLTSDGEETLELTGRPAYMLVSEQHPIPYIVDSEFHEHNDEDKPLYWDLSVTPAVKTTTDTGTPVILRKEKEFYSMQYEDTHEKIFGVNGNRLGWHQNV